MTLPVAPSRSTLAAALDGDAEALDELLRADVDGQLARRHRLASALWLRASQRRRTGPALDAWHRELRVAAARHLITSAAVDRIAASLARVGVEWIPLKGYDLATRTCEAPEERPMNDLDVLVRLDDYPRARRALEDDGWSGLDSGPLADRFLDEEGYAWMAKAETAPVLELHFRLWGLVPAALSEDFFVRSLPDPSLPPGGRRLTLADAYLVSAVHAWLTPARSIYLWWDLKRVAERLDDEAEVVAQARRWGLDLPVALSADVSGELWHDARQRRIASALATGWRWPERRLARRARRGDPTDLPLSRLAMARLLAGRPSRMGPRAVVRRVWAHPGIVGRQTPETWPWLARRLWSVLTSLGLHRPAAALRRVLERKEARAGG